MRLGFEPPPPDTVRRSTAGGLLRAGGPPWRVTREGYEAREFDDWDEAYAYFTGDRHLLVERTIQAGGRDK